MYWNDVWNTNRPALTTMTPGQRLTFCLACLEWSYQRLLSALSASAGDARLRQLGQYLASMPGHPASADLTISLAGLSDALADLAADVEEHCSNAFGFWDLAMGIAELADSLPSGLPDDAALAVASYAYQAILAREVLATLGEPLPESRVADLEKSNRTCREAIDTQLAFAAAAAHDQTLATIGLHPRRPS